MAIPAEDTHLDHEKIKALIAEVYSLRARFNALDTQNAARDAAIHDLQHQSTKNHPSSTNGHANGHIIGHSEVEELTRKVATAITARFGETKKNIEEIEGLCNNCNSSLEGLFSNVRQLEAMAELRNGSNGTAHSSESASPIKPKDSPGAYQYEIPQSPWLTDQIDRLKSRVKDTENSIKDIDERLGITAKLAQDQSGSAFGSQWGFQSTDPQGKSDCQNQLCKDSAQALSAAISRIDNLEKAVSIFSQRKQERLIDETTQETALLGIYRHLETMRTPDLERHESGVFAGDSIQIIGMHMPTPGLMLVQSHHLPTTTENEYNDFYNNTFAPAVLRLSPATAALRYKLHSPKTAEATYLALYPLPDASYLSSPDLANLIETTKMAGSLGPGEVKDYIHFSRSTWDKIQTLDRPGDQVAAQTLSMTLMTPAEGVTDAELEEWYAANHVRMSKDAKGYLRTTRYVRRADQGEGPRFLALHEYACKGEEMPEARIAKVLGQRYATEARVWERSVWELVSALGDRGQRL
ncbi:hypothetical protein B0A48_08051 [Cryoendolithus antarcticus]|uniref:Uncharacterized protein n=1 Tax=Cryoendolithus antarcticus TaxID=1507870 RepID=A0A1V8T194_9PEZI|nr:hypothetical protein B0A48_08051 [Cryoendolithus antarcticus]